MVGRVDKIYVDKKRGMYKERGARIACCYKRVDRLVQPPTPFKIQCRPPTNFSYIRYAVYARPDHRVIPSSSRALQLFNVYSFASDSNYRPVNRLLLL